MALFEKKNQEKEFLQQQLFQANNHIAMLERELNYLRSTLAPDSQNAYAVKQNLDAQIHSLQVTAGNISNDINSKQKYLQQLNNEIQAKNSQILQLDDEILYQDFGLYEPKYRCTNSEEYKARIQDVRKRQKALISKKCALNFFDGWQLDGSLAKGRALNNDNMKMVLLAFNSECDALIHKVKFNNIERIEAQILKAADRINRLNQRNRISITNQYQGLKLEELHLCYEYEVKKQEEKEEIRRIREQDREEKKLQKEIAEARKNITKEQTHYQNALSKLLKQIESVSEGDLTDLLAKKSEIEAHLQHIDQEIKDIDYREANQKAGYVYIISNIGSFGEGIYKIGMTRRLDPQDRVDELGDASVPFKFDVHAMIFSDDAPALEAALHRAFDSRKVNMVNNRKEFFRVTLDEIEDVVKKSYDKTVEFTRLPQAEQYRETQMIQKKLQGNLDEAEKQSHP